MNYKINVEGVWFAPVLSSSLNSIEFGKVEQIAEVSEINISPKLAEGNYYGNGVKINATSRKTSYEIAIDLTTIPQKYKSYIEGTTISGSGIEISTSKDEPRAFALGFMIEKTGNKRQCVWFLFCKAKPFEEGVKQSEDSIVYSNDKLVVTAMEHEYLGKFYTKIDEENENITVEKVEAFFTTVQDSDSNIKLEEETMHKLDRGHRLDEGIRLDTLKQYRLVL